MPTGVHLLDARQQLFDAAERGLLRDGFDQVRSDTGSPKLRRDSLRSSAPPTRPNSVRRRVR